MNVAHVIFFGLGDTAAVSRVEATLLSGQTRTVASIAIASTLAVQQK